MIRWECVTGREGRFEGHRIGGVTERRDKMWIIAVNSQLPAGWQVQILDRTEV